MKHTIAIIDGGGRGASLVAKYSQSPMVGKILAIPGNDFMQVNSKKPVTIFPEVGTTDISEIIKICQQENVSFVDVAQDNAVAVGLVDALLEKGFPTVGPTKLASEIEWNKSFARDFMKRHNIAQPEFFVFTSQKDGIGFLKKEKEKKWFVKASGLCEGKGALPAESNRDAIQKIKELKKFGQASDVYLLEEWLQGKKGLAEEFSAYIVSDGKNFQFLGVAQDHKRVGNFDTGLNTGGMGCVSNPLVFTQDIKNQVMEIAKKTIDGMREEGRVYKGILYVGGMVVDGKVFIIEYNARWGDPEAQVIIPSITNDLFEIGQNVLAGRIADEKIHIDKKIRIVIAGTAKGYPADYSSVKGKKIFGIEKAKKIKGVHILGAGIKKDKNTYVANGGRILYVIGEGDTILDAREKAHSAMSQIFIEGNNLQYRTDIGWRDLEKLSSVRM